MSSLGKTKSKKLIAFDLKQEALKEHYPYNYGKTNPQFYKRAYADIRDFMESRNWEHRQGSGYISKDELTDFAVRNLMKQMVKAMPWIDKCIGKFDVADIGEHFDLRETIANAAKN